jgi:hypothetical protein
MPSLAIGSVRGVDHTQGLVAQEHNLLLSSLESC